MSLFGAGLWGFQGDYDRFCFDWRSVFWFYGKRHLGGFRSPDWFDSFDPLIIFWRPFFPFFTEDESGSCCRACQENSSAKEQYAQGHPCFAAIGRSLNANIFIADDELAPVFHRRTIRHNFLVGKGSGFFGSFRIADGYAGGKCGSEEH